MYYLNNADEGYPEYPTFEAAKEAAQMLGGEVLRRCADSPEEIRLYPGTYPAAGTASRCVCGVEVPGGDPGGYTSWARITPDGAKTGEGGELCPACEGGGAE